jgi:hypothetical protein
MKWCSKLPGLAASGSAWCGTDLGLLGVAVEKRGHLIKDTPAGVPVFHKDLMTGPVDPFQLAGRPIGHAVMYAGHADDVFFSADESQARQVGRGQARQLAAFAQGLV